MLRTTLSRSLVALTVALLAPAAALAQGTATGTATADPAKAKEAQDAAERAKSLYRDGKFVEALLEFKRAYELVPTAALSYNIARCYEQLSQWDEAIKAYERFMTETTSPRDRTEATDKIEFLKTKISADSSSPDARYKARLDNGRKAFARGDYEAAIEEFKAAFDIKPTSAALFNIAKSYERMGRYEEAIDYFTQYLDLDPNAPDKADIEEQIRRLKKSIRERFQELSVSSEPPGADIYLDDRNTGLQGQTNFRFKAAPGPHTLYLDLNGYEPVKREFVMPDDKPLALEFTLKKLENVGFAVINVNVEGARIFIDGAIIGLTPYKQKKALTAGAHQVTIEAAGYPRYTQDFTVIRDQELPLNIQLEEYSEPVQDETLEKWGRNFILIGLIGGTLGVAAPFAYQKLILRRDLNEHLGPTQVNWGDGVSPDQATYWKGNPKEGGKIKTDLIDTDINANYRDNPTDGTLSTIQTISIVAGSIFCAAGLGFYVYKWVRDPERKQVVTADAGAPSAPSEPAVEITGLGLSPTEDGAHFGLMGRF
ncbi:MAG: PEGA domain-containing protein [Deltaproteobacteria bacterium]|nr:PEGA domain-containing protein [Deltaproteobacteria bacterium]